ncbi:MAG TPA: hypothetical protein H9676_04285 [Firmicutes bacterium]|nr:hypothetical protein [Bacillota bacterium]
MSAIQYLSTFRLYGWDVLLLAGGVTLLTSLLKKTVLKNVPKKLFVFLPFALGIVLYAIYRALVTLSAEPFTTGLAATVEGGFACGCAATLYYVVYEQFFRKRPTADTGAADGAGESETPDTGAADDADTDMGEAIPPVAPLLEGFVPEETRHAVARSLTEGARGKTGDALRTFVRETLFSAAPAATEAELLALTELVAAYLSSLSGT